MASTSSALALVIMTFLSIATFSMPSAKATLGIVNTAIVTGTVNCPSTTTVIPNVPVSLVCGNASLARVLAQGVTNLAGLYYFVLNTVDTTTFDAAKCQVSITVPPTTCTVNIPTGLLTLPLTVLNVISNVLGNLIIVVSGLA